MAESTQDIQVRPDIDRVLRLRRAGVPVQAIAKELQVDLSTVAEAIYEALALESRWSEDVGTAVALDLSRLDALQVTIWQNAVQGDLHALDRVLKIMLVRAKLLQIERKADHDDTLRRLSDGLKALSVKALSVRETRALSESVSDESVRAESVPRFPPEANESPTPQRTGAGSNSLSFAREAPREAPS